MSEQLAQGIVRILDINGDTAGTGFVVSESGLIATCSHVIQHEVLQKRGEARPEKVTIVFHATDDEQDARVEPNWWLPWNAGDLAIIRLEGILPQGVQPLPLGSARGTNGHEVSTFGFPDIDDIQGLGADGRVVRVLLNAERSILQLRSSEITAGFSGAPIWDKLGRRVIGMVSAITEPDRHHRLVETAFAISTEMLRNVCPALQLSEVCPYRGLAAFTEADTEFFFGRQQIRDGLLNRLRTDPRFLTVLGPSGSGKSSVVQAGIIPQLRSGKIPNSDHWGIVVTRPVTQPFDELGKQGLVGESHDLTENVKVWMSQNDRQERLVLVIDQFEELLSICPETIRQDFITQLVKLLHSPLPITVVLVMRDDFYSRLTQQEALVEWLERNRGPLHVPKLLKQDELIAIVQKPAEAVGLRCEEGLVETIVKDAMETAVESEDGGRAGRSAVLPLLEFALTELWRRRQEGMLTHEAYRDIGGVAGALTQWADRAFYTLKNGEKRLAQRILTDLVYMGDESQGILDSRRRRAQISLCRNEGEQESIQRVVQHLVENRLVVTDHDLQSNQETVEIIHDVLLREWGQLKDWLNEDRRFLIWHQELERLAQAWAIRRDKNKLLRGHDLTEAREWLRERKTDLSQNEVAFLRAGAASRLRSLVSAIVVMFLIVSSMGGASWVLTHQPPKPPDPTRVSTLQDNNRPGSLRYAVNEAPPKSTITFDTSLRGVILLTSGDLAIAKDLTIRGPGAGTLSISSGKSGSVVRVAHGVTVTIAGLAFKNSNTATGFINNEGTLHLTNSIISGNKSTNNTSAQFTGGGITNSGTLTVSNSTISGNTSTYSVGGIFNEGMLTLSNSIVSDNTAGAVSGGMLNTGTLTVSNSIVSGNTSYGAGGGIYNYGTLTLTDSTISGNKTSAGSTGGGIYNIGTLTLSNSTISGNMSGEGGGITNSGTLTLSNSTISGNSAKDGGGIIIQGYTGTTGPGNAYAVLLFSTIYANRASAGGDIAIEDVDFNNFKPIKQISEVQIISSIVAGDPAHPSLDIVGRLMSFGYNLFQDNSGATFDPATRTQHGTDRTLSANDLTRLFADPVGLQNNGGPTMTYALGPGSPAIDAVPLQNCDFKVIFNSQSRTYTDQRGVKRPDGNERFCDIGAYEYVDSANTPGPYGAPPDDASFRLNVTVQVSDPYVGEPFASNPVLIITGHPGPEGGTVCSPDDSGQSFTYSGTTYNHGTSFTETETATCSGMYKAGQISYIETDTSAKGSLQSNGVTASCVLNDPAVILQLTGAYVGHDTFSGTIYYPYVSFICDKKGSGFYQEELEGTWTGTIVTQ